MYSLTSDGIILDATVVVDAGGISGVDVPERDCARGALPVAGAELRFEGFCAPSRGRSPIRRIRFISSSGMYSVVFPVHEGLAAYFFLCRL